MNKYNGHISSHLFEIVKTKIDFGDFLESNVGCNLQWLEENKKARTYCPMPHHNDQHPSFNICLTDDGVWIYHCLGCGSGGTIIDFCLDYYGHKSVWEALIFLCKKYKFEDTQELVIQCLKDAKKKISLRKKIDFAHIVTANQCRMLLVKDYKRHSKWVAAAYRRMNKALDEEDIELIDSVGYEAHKRMTENE